MTIHHRLPDTTIDARRSRIAYRQRVSRTIAREAKREIRAAIMGEI